MTKQPSIVVIGGGTGSFTLLNELKHLTKHITALVNMVDDGGSTGVLRDELGVLPPGDVRQCLVALSDSTSTLREVFNYRFPKGTTFAGHSLGNLFLSGIESMTADFNQAIAIASQVLHVQGEVIPMTLDKCHLVMETAAGAVEGEYKISTMQLEPGERPFFRLSPKAIVNPKAAQAIKDANVVVIAPGNLYGSLVPALLPTGVGEALKTTDAHVIYVCNLVNKPHQTANFAVHDYVDELQRFVGEGSIDTVLYNTDKPSKELLETYAVEKELPVVVNEAVLAKKPYRAIGGKFLAKRVSRRNKNDTFIHRSLIRHDAAMVAQAIMELKIS